LAWVNPATVYDDVGEKRATTNSPAVYVRPNSAAILATTWKDPQMREGRYRVEARVNFDSGYAIKEDLVTLSKISQSIKSKFQATKDGLPKCPWWIMLVIIIIALIGHYLQPSSIWLLLVVIAVAALIVICMLAGPVEITWGLILTIIIIILLIIYWVM